MTTNERNFRGGWGRDWHQKWQIDAYFQGCDGLGGLNSLGGLGGLGDFGGLGCLGGLCGMVSICPIVMMSICQWQSWILEMLVHTSVYKITVPDP